VARSLELWKENEKRWNRKLYWPTGALWFVGEDEEYAREALSSLEEAGLEFEELGLEELEKRYPQANFDEIKWAIYEPDAGYILARYSCAVLVENFVAEGGQYRQLAVEPGSIEDGKMDEIRLSDGSRLAVDQYVFACGPWLHKLFPDVLGDLIRISRQEVFFFGTRSGDPRFTGEGFPVWIDGSDRSGYGIPGSSLTGFKLASGPRGPLFDPTSDERMPTPERMEMAREYMRFRFPDMKDAPLLEARVCPYSNTVDSNFIVDRHPEAENVWLVGGGSGHGFKHGPAIGELAAGLALGQKAPEPTFALSRFSR
jgi:glycine/D-amino acid oxidase-like deaminating enzyme